MSPEAEHGRLGYAADLAERLRHQLQALADAHPETPIARQYGHAIAQLTDLENGMRNLLRDMELAEARKKPS